MKTSCQKDSIVWSKGDLCMSPYSGDNDLYRGVIHKLKRSPAGDVLALVKFDGYGEDDIEEVRVELLEKVKADGKIKEACGKVKEKANCRKKGNSFASTQGGMFSPLQGSEASQRLKERYGLDEEDELSVKSQKLSSVLFGKKSPGSSSFTKSENKLKKPIVVTGGEKLQVSRGNKTPSDKDRFVEPISPSVSHNRKQKLDITRGQAKNIDDELPTSRVLSDISSILDSKKVKKALMRHSEHNISSSDSDDESVPKFDANNTYVELENVKKTCSKQREHTLSSFDDENQSNGGFNEEDMEKPKFTFKPDGAKVPFILSGDDEASIVQVPGTLNQYLRDYQREGIKFLFNHYVENRGAILGDDMGLGKTVQVIGFLSALLGKQGNRVDVMRQKPRFIRKLSDSASVRRDTPNKGPFLIIGPGCVLFNWLEELDTWGYFSVRKYHGSDKAECFKEIKKGKLEIVVTTFETFREHMTDLNTIHWDAVIVDEVHKIKDMKARTTKALREINTYRRFGLTGTALQNNLLEFWSILDWAQPDCLGSQADFIHEFVRPIEGGQRHDANKRELATARKQKNKLAEIRKTMMIRRVKSLIADQLPKKDDSVVFCKLSQLQVSIYRTILEQPEMDYVIHGDDPCSCDSGEPQSKCCKQKTPDGQSVKSLRFTFMHLLLKTSNHVALLIPTEKTSKKQASTARKICEAALREHPEFVAQTKEASFKTLSDPKYCGKMKILQGLLKVFYKEHSKVLVFSYSTQVLDIIEQHLMSTGYEFRRIDGTVSAKKRMIVVREFNTDPNIFICLISTKAGGLGLNLTGANKVVIFDPNWNPTHDLQAQDRAYRIGQRRDVQVYRLISTGTIEENMYLRQIYKQQLLNVTIEDENAKRYFYAVQGNPHQKGEIFGVKNMFILRTGESCITRDIIKRNERVESALEGFETAQYVPPVVRVEDDEDYDDLVVEGDTNASIPSTASESEDMFAQIFSSSDESDIEDKRNDVGEINSLGLAENTRAKKKNCLKTNRDITKLDDNEADERLENLTKSNSRDLERPKVRFQMSTKGKVKPSDSRTGKGPLRSNKNHSRAADDDKRDDDNDGDGNEVGNMLHYDQTLAGTFADVSDVFDNCGVVHIHKNVKVVGGSRAEDHMSRCAISDVYDFNKNSQDLAAQCEPMSESSEEEEPLPEKKRRGQSVAVEDHNTVRSMMIGNTKILIGQTPKAFRLKHFEEMSTYLKAGSLLEFAEMVLGSNLEERVDMLNRFYKSKEPNLDEVHKFKKRTNRLDEDTRGSYSKNKYEKVKRKEESKVRKVTPSSSRVRKICSGISFLDEVVPDSESLSQKTDRSDNPRTNTVGSSMEVGRKVSPRKRACKSPNRKLMKKCKISSNREHKTVPQTYFEDCDNLLEENYKQETYADQGESANVEDLLDEIGRTCEHDDNSVKGNHVKVKRIEGKRNSSQSSSMSSVLDDVFEGLNSSYRFRKPPPSNKVKTNSPVKRIGRVKEETHDDFPPDDDDDGDDNDDPFKIVDEIFSFNSDKRKPGKKSNKGNISKCDVHVENNKKTVKTDIKGDNLESDDEVNLEDSTLKDDNYDCFDDPKLWKKRKRKAPDKRSAVDRLIHCSDCDYNDLFTSGKLKKKEPKSTVRKEKFNSEKSEFDGSASLF